MSKPVRCLWRKDYATREAYEKEMSRYRRYGFRVVAYEDGKQKDIQAAMKEIIKNHLKAY